MKDLKTEFLDYMDLNGVRYRELNDHAVLISYHGEKLNTISIHVIFEQDHPGIVKLACWEIAHFPEDRLEAGFALCNRLNSRFRWVKFYLDEDRDFRAELDLLVNPSHVGEPCTMLVAQMAQIIDEAYPEITRALWPS